MRPSPALLLILLLSAAPVGPLLAAETDRPIPQVMMGRLQEDLDLTPYQAAALLGNLAQETGNFTHLQQVGGPSYGYSQWLGSRKRAFLAYAERNGGKRSFGANYGFLLHEVRTQYPEMVDRIRGSETVDEAARVFMREFLRPSRAHANLPARIRYAERYLAGDFDGSGCLGPDHLNGDRIRPCPATVLAAGGERTGPLRDLLRRIVRLN